MWQARSETALPEAAVLRHTAGMLQRRLLGQPLAVRDKPSGITVPAIDAIVMASAARRGDLVSTPDLVDLESLRTYFPAVRVLAV